MDEMQIVVCELKEELYGLDISRVYEIIRLQPITVVPQAPKYVEGVINLRGRIVPVVDLSMRFGMAHSEATKASRIIVAGTGDLRVGLIVDGVSEVLMIREDAIEPTPAAVSTAQDSKYLRGIAKLGDHLVILLEMDALFGKEDRQLLEQAA
jgi:purine-binding chemotaxis protein CheW